MIEQALFTHITTDSTIAALMGPRLFPNKIPQGQPLPAAEYQQEGGVRTHTMAGADGHGGLRIFDHLLCGFL